MIARATIARGGSFAAPEADMRDAVSVHVSASRRHALYFAAFPCIVEGVGADVTLTVTGKIVGLDVQGREQLSLPVNFRVNSVRSASYGGSNQHVGWAIMGAESAVGGDNLRTGFIPCFVPFRVEGWLYDPTIVSTPAISLAGSLDSFVGTVERYDAFYGRGPQSCPDALILNGPNIEGAVCSPLYIPGKSVKYRFEGTASCLNGEALTVGLAVKIQEL